MASIQSTKITSTPTTGQTVTLANQDGDILAVINPAGSLLALTVAFPSSPTDGQRVSLVFSQIITGLTLTSSGTILSALTTIASSNLFATWVYNVANTTWYRIG